MPDLFATKKRVQSLAVLFQTKAIGYVPKGCIIAYPCGTVRFVANSWYSDINTDNL